MVLTILSTVVSFIIGTQVQRCIEKPLVCKEEREQRINMMEVRNANEIAWWRRH